MTISSSLPLASHRPEWAQRTVSTGPVCIDNVHSDFGGLPDSSLAWLSIGFVLHIRTLASRPPVAIREPSGWTCTENMDRRFGFESLFAESLWMTHAGLVKCIVVNGGCFRLWRAGAVFGNHQCITQYINRSHLFTLVDLRTSPGTQISGSIGLQLQRNYKAWLHRMITAKKNTSSLLLTPYLLPRTPFWSCPIIPSASLPLLSRSGKQYERLCDYVLECRD